MLISPVTDTQFKSLYTQRFRINMLNHKIESINIASDLYIYSGDKMNPSRKAYTKFHSMSESDLIPHDLETKWLRIMSLELWQCHAKLRPWEMISAMGGIRNIFLVAIKTPNDSIFLFKLFLNLSQDSLNISSNKSLNLFSWNLVLGPSNVIQSRIFRMGR